MNIRFHALSSALLGAGLLSAQVGHTEFLPSVAGDRVSTSIRFDGAPLGLKDGSLTEADVRRIGRQAYVWGWPSAYVHQCRVSLSRVPTVGRSSGLPVAPPNELCMLTDYITPGQTVVTCPNQDVIYGYGILDLALEPVVLQVPDFGDRFWVYQLGDQRTDGFASVGKMYGTKPGRYLIVGPGWNGTVPEGFVDVFRCPTKLGYCLPRVFLDDTAEDRAAVQPVLNQIMAYPLSRAGDEMKTADWTKVRWLPSTTGGARSRNKWVTPESFFEVLGELLDEVPPLPGEEAMYAQFRRVLRHAEAEPRLKETLVAAAAEAESELLAPMFEFRNLGNRLPHHWTTISNGANFGTDYLTRAAVAKSNIFVNRNNEAKYFYQDLDANGVRLDGNRSYRVTFAAGKLPPAGGFWSLTLYDDKHAFAPNELGRYSLGTKNKNLRFNADGSLTIVVQSHAPAEAERANWLPAPKGAFSLYLRAYGPEPKMLNGSWTPPPVVPAAAGQLAHAK